ncbi:TetR/AcrR family transcriptional regulator [Gottfriedia sp. NPDC056225]|uniref:TetR/AcrR family transcriptional regulator n=1 Tax=Gottfriedia sp. NPDC056225 TaxID=3345751 RepID=UPI0015593DF8|nr:TetR family transcriptional regulator [Arthrobacter citreus]
MVQPSKLKLMNALVELLSWKELDQVTVMDLIRTANISRSSFYRNFVDKFEFLDWTMDYLLSGITPSKMNPKPTANDFYPYFFNYFYQHRLFFRTFATQSTWPSFTAKLIASGKQAYEACFEDKATVNIPSSILANYIVNAHVGVILNWLCTDNPCPPDEMADYVTQITESVLQSRGTNLETLFDNEF